MIFFLIFILKLLGTSDGKGNDCSREIIFYSQIFSHIWLQLIIMIIIYLLFLCIITIC